MKGDKLQEMIYEYKKGQPAFALNRGIYKGYEFLVLSLGRHPCGYVCLTEKDEYFNKFYDDIPVECHGGLTFSEPKISFLEWSDKYKNMIRTSIKDKWVIGWDYAHLGDYTVFERCGEKHTTKEITEECKSVINQLRRR